MVENINMLMDLYLLLGIKRTSGDAVEIAKIIASDKNFVAPFLL